MIAFLGALREEVSGLQRQMGLKELLAGATCRLYGGEYRGKDILLAQTGMGRQRAETATELVLERHSVAALISFGFAGALTGELDVGDLVICATLHCAPGPAQKATGPRSYASDEGLLRQATEALEGTTLRFRIGSGVTAAQLVRSPEGRQQLGRAFHADIVDMESYWIARIAADRQIPFVAVRAISDTWRDDLPPFDQMTTPDGSVKWKEAFSHFLRHPQQLLTLLGLANNARRARESLTAFTDYFLAKA